ncbi:uncharacterized protein LOC108590274 isoform X3 [Callithrix jacchus]|uniref:uncharacterized protein LOC108590274 isoform X3 n=1 Tax=Callithrix jacchus TaxID=9483 RepID=UPI00159D50A5|nr:uncharacterized protein LOC108590274 isoform X3 [Callithrix jacchus]
MSPSTHSCGSRPAGEGESERGGAGAAEGLPGRWRGSRGAAGGGGRGRAVARRPAGSSREPAGRAEPEPQPERGGGGRSQSGRRLCRRSRGAATLAPRPPPRSLALTPGRRRRAARAPPAPHGRPRHWALRPPRRCPARSSAPRRVPERSHCSRRRPRENTERSLPTHPPLSPQEPLICFRQAPTKCRVLGVQTQPLSFGTSSQWGRQMHSRDHRREQVHTATLRACRGAGAPEPLLCLFPPESAPLTLCQTFPWIHPLQKQKQRLPKALSAPQPPQTPPLLPLLPLLSHRGFPWSSPPGSPISGPLHMLFPLPAAVPTMLLHPFFRSFSVKLVTPPNSATPPPVFLHDTLCSNSSLSLFVLSLLS